MMISLMNFAFIIFNLKFLCQHSTAYINALAGNI
jgi:hypothetical protein